MTNQNDIGEFADYYSYLGTEKYLYLPTRTAFPASKVNNRTRKGFTKWLDKNRAIHSVTWAPGLPTIIENKIAVKTGWQDKRGAHTLNNYIPPTPIDGDPADITPWLDLGAKLWGDDLDHILNWLAMRAQHPEIKINHSLLLGSSAQGTGKSMWLQPLRRAVGEWNFSEVSARRAKEKATSENPWLGSTILLISEVHDLGEQRFAFYDATKDWAAGPPDTLLVRDLYAGAYHIQNTVGVIYTSNHKLDGLYLPRDDRRHFVAWSDAEVEHAGETDEARTEFFHGLQRWYDAGGLENVAAYLATRDVESFDAKAPPPKTDAWRDIIEAGETTEDNEIAEVLDYMGRDLFDDEADIVRPDAFTLNIVKREAARCGQIDLIDWISDPANNRKLPHRIEKAGYTQVRNPDAASGRWRIGDDRLAIYARRGLSLQRRVEAARDLVRAEVARARRASLRIVA